MSKVKTLQITPEMRKVANIDEHLLCFGVPEDVPVIFYIKNDEQFIGKDKDQHPMGEGFTITVDVFEKDDVSGTVLFTTHNCKRCAMTRIECVVETTPFFVKDIQIERSEKEDKMRIEMTFNFQGPNVTFLSNLLMMKALFNIKEKEVTNEPS